MEVNRYFDIINLLDKILFALKPLNPVHCYEPNDPRLKGYYISINKNHFMIINGCDSCDMVSIYKNDNIGFDITTQHGLEMFSHDGSDVGEEMLELDLNVDPFYGSIDDFVLYLTNFIEQNCSPLAVY
jgi:hypothetical protein